MKLFLIYAMSIASTVALYNTIAPIAQGLDAPILAIAQQAPGAAMPAAQAQALAAQYQSQAQAIRLAEANDGVSP